MTRKRKTGPGDPDPPPSYVDHNGASAVDERDDGGPDYGQPYKFDPDFSGPVKKRSCTDVICLLIFIAFLGGWGFVAFMGMTTGDINKVRAKSKVESFL